jgi:hypothetical protein
VSVYMESIINTSFENILEPLQHNGWQFIKSQSNCLVMNKKYYELDEINIEYKNSFYHFSLPINNSSFSYYKKIADEQQSIQFLKIYVSDLHQ